MQLHTESLLVRITDLVWAPYKTFGAILQLVPDHHVVMENVMRGKSSDPRGESWETYDLKPADYFYPERDVLQGHLSSEAAKDKVVDLFDDKIRITKAQSEKLKGQLENDTDFLKAANTVDYSLLLVRCPANSKAGFGDSWRSGIQSTDKKWIYRAVVLDFFWTKHKLPAKAMTGLIKSYNVIDRQGPMSLTTSAGEFKTRFMAMVESIIEPT